LRGGGTPSRAEGGEVSGPLVSVVIPAFNSERFLARTLVSVSRQTYRALEIIVVDDGSLDGTAGIVSRQAAIDPRVRLIRQENAGVAAARNRGIAESSGCFVAPLDADDLWHPQKIELQLRRFEERPSAGLVYCWSIGIDEEDRVMPQRVSPASFEGDVFAALVFQNFIGNASSPLIRRDCLNEVGGFDPALRAAGGEGCEDRKLYLDIAERHDFAVVPLFLVGYRQLAGSMSWNYDKMLRSHELIMAQARRRRPELPERIFRWSNARTRFYLALRALSSGRRRDGVRLCASALLRDPSLLFSHWFRYSALRAVGKLAGRGRADAGVHVPFELSPPDHAIVRAGWSVQRQRNFVAETRIQRRAAAPEFAERCPGKSAVSGAEALSSLSRSSGGD
jgi:glycosyltransferase involved in cell wall biosynthesis